MKKTFEQRIGEFVQLRRQFLALGLPRDNEGVRQVLTRLEAFARHGEGFSGKVRLDGLGYTALMKLSCRAQTVSDMTLRRDA
jgi:hypothetical protein